MKSVFCLAFLLSACAGSHDFSDNNFLIKLWDYNYSMAYTAYYEIRIDSVKVTMISDIKGESNKVLFGRKITEKEKENLVAFLSDFPLTKLDTLYNDPLISDGDQKRIDITFNDKRKIIDVQNIYEKNIDELINAINVLFKKDIQIKYRK